MNNQTLENMIYQEFNIGMGSKQKHIPFCMNCGNNDHIMRKCTKPIISLGIINIFIPENKILFDIILNFYILHIYQ